MGKSGYDVLIAKVGPTSVNPSLSSLTYVCINCDSDDELL